MTETKYTEKELQEMADALLKEADAQQHEIEEEVIKSNKGHLDEKTIASLPAAQLIQNNERLKELFIKGKRHGKLESNELSEVLDAMDLDSDKHHLVVLFEYTLTYEKYPRDEFIPRPETSKLQHRRELSFTK